MIASLDVAAAGVHDGSNGSIFVMLCCVVFSRVCFVRMKPNKLFKWFLFSSLISFFLSLLFFFL